MAKGGKSIYATAHDDTFMWFWFLIALLALGGGAAGQLVSSSASTPPSSQSAPAPSAGGTSTVTTAPTVSTAPAAAAAPAAPVTTTAVTTPPPVAPQAVTPTVPALPRLQLHFHGSLPTVLDGLKTKAKVLLKKAERRVTTIAAAGASPAASASVPATTAPANTTASASPNSASYYSAPDPLPVPYGSVFLSLPSATSGCQAANALPDRSCTPGVVFANAGPEDVCAVNYSTQIRYVSLAEKNAVYRAYGVGDHYPGQYQIDHLVPLELGGTNDFANLWPQSQAWPGYRQKDVVENDLHRAVCWGQMPLAVAQARIAAFWKQTDWPLQP